MNEAMDKGQQTPCPHLWAQIDSQSSSTTHESVRCSRCGAYGELCLLTDDVFWPAT